MSIKARVLAILEENRGKNISGSEIAVTVGVSRSAVWKAVKKLQEEGYTIYAATNRGYCLSVENDMLSEQSIIPLLNTREFGRKMDVFKSVDSTNIFAKSLAQLGAVSGTTVIAETQTAGRGRKDRSFYSPSGMGLYMSIVLRPRLPVHEAAGLITSYAAVVVARAIQNLTGLDPKIKWVNDIYIEGKKVCGILTEASVDFESGMLDYAVVGMGVNVAGNKFPEELKDTVTSLLQECQKKISRSLLAAEILNQFESQYDELSAGRFLEEYAARSNVLGKEVTVLAGNGDTYTATAKRIDGQARLVVELPGGEEQTLSSGEISIRVGDSQ